MYRKIKKGFFTFLLAAGVVALVGCGGSTDAPETEEQISVSADEIDSKQDAVEETDMETESVPEEEESDTAEAEETEESSVIDLSDIPEYDGSPFVSVNDNQPEFAEKDLTTKSFETYSDLDDYGRCGVAYANVGQDLMPTEERGSIGKVKPSGWHTVKYDIVDGKYLYNRCHLIGYQLTAENANERNLITGTRYLNVDGMLPFENMVADYVKETGNHVLYRVTPVYEEDNLVASGVQMEAMSVEDEGDGILFNVFCYNVQPGISIDYETGESCLDTKEASAPDTEDESEKAEEKEQKEEKADDTKGITYIINVNTDKFHYPGCSSVDQMNDSNKREYSGSRDELISQGYDPCKRCNP